MRVHIITFHSYLAVLWLMLQLGYRQQHSALAFITVPAASSVYSSRSRIGSSIPPITTVPFSILQFVHRRQEETEELDTHFIGPLFTISTWKRKRDRNDSTPTYVWRRNVTNMMRLTKTSMAVATLAIMVATNGAAPSMATDSTIIASTVNFSNEYQDPLHPSCRRKIVVDRKNNDRLSYSGTYVGESSSTKNVGCTPKEVEQFGGLKVERWDGTIVIGNDNRNRIVVRGDNGNGMEGVWEPADAKNAADGIRWADGSKWTVISKSPSTLAGEGVGYAWLGISAVAGVKGVVDKVKEKSQEEAET